MTEDRGREGNIFPAILKDSGALLLHSKNFTIKFLPYSFIIKTK
jgi:hypothetical protein